MALLGLAPVHGAGAQDAPRFMQDTWPSGAVEGAWQEFQAVMDSDGALGAKTRS